MCVRSYPGGVSSVCLLCVHGWKRELKNKKEAMLWWFGVPICLRICRGMMLLKATRKQESIEVPLSALWCCVVIHNRSQQSLCFVPYRWQCSHLLDRICRLKPTHFGSATAPLSGQHQAGPSHIQATRSHSSRCLRSARRSRYGATVAGVIAGSKGWSRRHALAGCWRQSRLLMSGHQINNLLHVVIHCAKSHFSSMITFLCTSIANKKTLPIWLALSHRLLGMKCSTLSV